MCVCVCVCIYIYNIHICKISLFSRRTYIGVEGFCNTAVMEKGHTMYPLRGGTLLL